MGADLKNAEHWVKELAEYSHYKSQAPSYI